MSLYIFYVVSVSLPITLYLFVFLQHFLRCQISFFNTGDLIAKAHINSLKGVRRNSQVTWGNSNKASIQSGIHPLCKTSHTAKGSNGVS